MFLFLFLVFYIIPAVYLAIDITIWLHGTKYLEESHSGTMVFSSDEKRDTTFDAFNLALSEWAKSWSGYVVGKFNYD